MPCLGMSFYLKNAVLNAALHGTPFTLPSRLFLAAFVSAPSDIGGAEPGSPYGQQPSSTYGYQRMPVTFGPVTGGTAASTSNVSFPLAAHDWGGVAGFGIYDDGGNLLFYGLAPSPLPVIAGDLIGCNAGDISVALS